MRALNRKLLRELVRHRSQVISIGLVMAGGTMTIMGLRSTLASIREARDAYFDSHRFADVFVHVQRAPAPVQAQIAALPGVAAVDVRIVRDVRLDVPGLAEPATGHMVSVPETRRPMLNELHLRRGRWLAPGRDEEILISERFAEMNHLEPGDSLAAVINGRWRRLRIVGTALSPEFVVELGGAEVFFDNQRYGIAWTNARALESAFDMSGAFNDAVIRLAPGASEPAVIAAVDQLMEPWGSTGAYGRRDQPAARALEDEFTQLRVNATIFPMFFLFVAAFLLNVVLSRLVASQRDEIAALKAFGYTNREVGTHYLLFALAAVLLGTALGLPLGAWMGAGFTRLYVDYFRFPTLPSQIDWPAALLGVAISGGLALLGAFGAVRRVMALPPAEALRPESPPRFRPLLLERVGLGRWISPSVRMVLRNLERRPLRTGSTVLGMALAVGLVSSGRFPYDAFDRLMFVEFTLAQRYSAAAVFTGDRPARAAEELRHVPGVVEVEAFRGTSVRLRRGAVTRTTAITGLPADGRLMRLVDERGRAFPVPASGAVITDGLARVLGVRAGDTLMVELLAQGARLRALPIAGVVDAMMGQGLFMDRQALGALLGEGDAVSGAYLAIAPGQEAAVFDRLRELPAIVGAISRDATIRNIREQIRDSMVFVLGLIITSACVIAVGVVYNSARIALSERGRELASLRVLGFSTDEVSGLLLGEQGVVTAAAIPLGIAIGGGFAMLLVHGFETERFHFPFVMTLRSQLFASVVVIGAGVLAGAVVRRRVARLDLVSALRTRE